MQSWRILAPCSTLALPWYFNDQSYVDQIVLPIYVWHIHMDKSQCRLIWTYLKSVNYVTLSSVSHVNSTHVGWYKLMQNWDLISQNFPDIRGVFGKYKDICCIVVLNSYVLSIFCTCKLSCVIHMWCKEKYSKETNNTSFKFP